jgi:surface polysaccharide O-acyltransferase-like enzyme
LDPKAGQNTLPVDLIRTVGIVLVIFLHASTESYLSSVNLMSPQGVEIWWASNVYDSFSRTCIPLFVMLAGALLLQTNKADEPIGEFFKKRWARLGVPFIFWVAVYFLWDIYINGKTVTAPFIVQGILTGPYYQFWFLYLLFGLYLITPALRVLIKYASRRLLKYVLAVWFVGTTAIPFLGLAGYYLNGNFFIFTGWIGYFVLGIYLTRTNIKKRVLIVGLVAGLLFTIFGTYLTIATLGEKYSQFFYDGFSINMIVLSASLFLLLLAFSTQKLQLNHPRINRALRTVSANTLPIYLLHVIILESLEKGYLGFTLKITDFNAYLSIPFLTLVTLFICLAIILPLKRIPYVKRLIG